MTADLLVRVRAMGGEVLHESLDHTSLRIQLNLERVEALAALPGVGFVQPRQDATTSRVVGVSPRPAMSREECEARTRPLRRELFRERLGAFLGGAVGSQLPNIVGGTGVGSRSSEGDVTHRAFDARGTFHVDGTGIRIGVLSDGVTNLAASQALGDLGPVTVLAGQTGSGDAKAPMLEIIHDLAPGAQLYFATAFTSITRFGADDALAVSPGGEVVHSELGGAGVEGAWHWNDPPSGSLAVRGVDELVFDIAGRTADDCVPYAAGENRGMVCDTLIQERRAANVGPAGALATRWALPWL